MGNAHPLLSLLRALNDSPILHRRLNASRGSRRHPFDVSFSPQKYLVAWVGHLICFRCCGRYPDCVEITQRAHHKYGFGSPKRSRLHDFGRELGITSFNNLFLYSKETLPFITNQIIRDLLVYIKYCDELCIYVVQKNGD